jgi:hypothetical protein
MSGHIPKLPEVRKITLPALGCSRNGNIYFTDDGKT